MKIDILGSCVTRDAFSIINNNHDINNYFSRSSIISLYSKKIKIDQKKIKLNSAFQKRMVYYDFVKRFRSSIKTSESNYLIIDFIDERLKKGRINNSYFTISNEFLNSNLDLDYKVLNNDKCLELWLNKAQYLVAELKNYGPEKVILHKAFWKKNYYDSNGDVQIFENAKIIDVHNKLLNNYYDYIEQELTDYGLNIINEIPGKADSNHRWGLEPFHYEPNYYKKFIASINCIILNVENPKK